MIREMSLRDKIEETKRIFDASMAAAKLASENAEKELLLLKHQDEVHKRFARMYVYKLQKTIKSMNLESRL